jgi:hypothetical protein
MKRLIEQLTGLANAAAWIEDDAVQKPEGLTDAEKQSARDLIITTRRHLNAIEDELGLPEPLPMRVMEPDYVPDGGRHVGASEAGDEGDLRWEVAV